MYFWCLWGGKWSLHLTPPPSWRPPSFPLNCISEIQTMKIQAFFKSQKVCSYWLTKQFALFTLTDGFVPSSAVLLVILYSETIFCGNGGNFIAFSSASGVKSLVSVNDFWELKCVCSSVKSVGMCAFTEMVCCCCFCCWSHCYTSSVLSWKCQSLRKVIALLSGSSEGESSKWLWY